MELKKAQSVAVGICEYIKDYCEENKVHIAGSIRRQKHEPKDIEIVLLPKRIENMDIFGAVISAPVTLDFKIHAENIGKVIKGNVNGRYMQIELKQKIMLDLFIPVPTDFYRIFAIRTGSSMYAHNVIAGAWLALGWCGSDMGLRRQEDCKRIKEKSGKNKWICVNKNGELPPVWKSEAELFDWLRIKFVHPQMRVM
ncbi:MAG: hypothetical protein ABI366_11100 [Ginsengibacter sp.]